MESETKRQSGKVDAGLEEGSEGALGGEKGVSEHGKKVIERKEGVSVGRNDGCP